MVREILNTFSSEFSSHPLSVSVKLILEEISPKLEEATIDSASVLTPDSLQHENESIPILALGDSL